MFLGNDLINAKSALFLGLFWLCLVSIGNGRVLAGDEIFNTSFSVPCLVVPGRLEFIKYAADYDPSCIGDDEEIVGEININELLEIQKMAVMGPSNIYCPTISQTSSKMEDPPPNQCFYNGTTLRCNFGNPTDDGFFETRLFVTADTPGTSDITARVWIRSQGRETAQEAQPVPMTVMAVGQRLIYPWISNNAGQFESTLVATNYGEQETVVLLTAYRREGEPETVIRTIPARGALREQASSLFPVLGSGGGYAVVLESEAHPVAGHWVTNNLVTGSGRSPSQGVAVPIADLNAPWNQRMGKTLMYGYLPITQDLTSAPVVVNLGPDTADVRLRFYNSSGQLVFEDTETLRGLPPFRPFATVINNLVPDGAQDLHMVAASENRLTGVAFVFNNQGEPAIGNALGIAE